MDLTRPFCFPAFTFLARLFVPTVPPRPESEPGADAGDTAAPASLHADLGLPPTEDVPPDAQALRHAMTMRIG